jgi:type I restriction enzyme, S subunit
MSADDYVEAGGWSAATIASLAEPTGIAYGVLKPGPKVPNGIPMLRVTDVRAGRVDSSAIYRISSVLDEEYSRTKLRGGEVVLSIQGTVGRVAVIPDELAGANISRTLAMIRLEDPSLASWVQRALESPHVQQAMRDAVGGTTRDSYNLRDLRRLTIPIAPADSRATILPFLDRAERLVASSTTRLVGAQRAVTRLRQSILASACSGRLTADWRDQTRSTSGVAPAASSQGPSKPAEIPDSWERVPLGRVAEIRLGGTPSRKTDTYWNGGVPWISSGEVANCRISDTRETISGAGLKNSNAKLYPAGTVLIAMIGEGKTRGQSAILDIEASTNQNVAGILPNPALVSSEYVWRWALAQYEITRAAGRGGNQPALNGQKVRELMIPVPPLAEQHEIVARVDRLVTLTDTLATRTAGAVTSVERSSCAVLAKAFRGDL